jgi:hypothetical protein
MVTHKEQRKHERFLAPKGAFVGVRPDFCRLGQIVDICMGGLAFRYIADERCPNASHELEIFLTSGDFMISNIPFRTVSDTETQSVPYTSLSVRRCGVQFGELTHLEMTQLEHFIQNYTTSQEKA